jgi:hypothetical protein
MLIVLNKKDVYIRTNRIEYKNIVKKKKKIYFLNN